MKYCRDCRWFDGTGACRSPSVPTLEDPVHGPYCYMRQARSLREHPEWCGHDARWWEAPVSWWERVKARVRRVVVW